MATETTSGTVTDDNGNKIAGATVTCENIGTGKIVATTTSDSSGHFSFTDTVGGNYMITATKDGHTYDTTLDNEGGATSKSGLQY